MSAFALVAWLAAATPTPAAATPTAAAAAVTLGFADQLARDGDWYRAITEYRRFVHHFPDHALVGAAGSRVGALYEAAGKYEAAAAAYQVVARGTSDPEKARAAQWQAGRCLELAGRWLEAAALYTRYFERHPAGPEADNARYRHAWTLVEAGAVEGAKRALADTPPSGEFSSAGRDLETALDAPDPSGRSPVLAGVLSAVLPGAGQAYAGRWGDGALALLVNATFLFGTYQAWINDNTATAVVMGMFGAGFYVGGVFGGVNAAHRHNDAVRQHRRSTWRKRFAAPEGSTPPPRVDLPLLGGSW